MTAATIVRQIEKDYAEKMHFGFYNDERPRWPDANALEAK